MIVDGLERFNDLEEELGYAFDWHKSGILLIIRTQSSWDHWQKRASQLTAAGIPTQVIDRQTLQKAEPNMNTNELLGAVYATEGMLNPLKFSLAYASAARQAGAIIQGNSRVTGFETANGRVSAVRTACTTYSCGNAAVMTGAWAAETTRMAGVDIPIRHAHAEAIVTEPVPQMIFNNVEISDFYETIHGKQRAVAIGVHPDVHGSIDISEAVTQTDAFYKRVSAWGITALANELLDLYPFLNKVRVMRGWGRPTCFTPDEEPIIGWVPQIENMFVAASLVETITAVPVLSGWMAAMLQGRDPSLSLSQFSPQRFANGWSWG
jgi:sarcosine oxidase subunit beta